MKCQKVQKHLSCLLDQMLDDTLSAEVSEHVDQCSLCRRELERLALLRTTLGSLGRVAVPKFLRQLVHMRLDNTQHSSWGVRLRDVIEHGWCTIRTTEGTWYLTRMAGTAMTFVFFFALYSAMSPLYFSIRPQLPGRGGPQQDPTQQLASNVLKNLGLMPMATLRRPINPSEPMINDLNFLKFGQTASQRGADDSFTVVALVDRSGSAKIANVLEYPSDSSLLVNFTSMITSARCRPASQNGRAVEGHLVLTFSKISVYD